MTDVAGYRVLRTIGHGDRTRLVLGFADDRTAVLKIGSPDDARMRVELEALTRAAGEHVVALEDVGLDEDEAVLVLERLRPGSLGDLLERRAGLDAGEAVTILAPIATTLDRIHSVGVAHSALSLGSVCFRDDGAPTLVGFGRAELFSAGSPEVVLETVHGVIADRAALRDLVALVLTRVTGPRADAARRLAAGLGEALPAAIAGALFDLAAASEIRFAADEEPAVEPRMIGLIDPVEPDVAAVATLPPWLAGLIPDGVRGNIEEVWSRARAIWTGWDQRRRRIVLGLAVGALVLMIALTIVPGGSSQPVAANPIATPTASSLAPVPELPDDPLDAAQLLLDLRERCIRDLSLLCLDDVDQQDSSGLAADRELIQMIEAGGEYPGDGVVAGDLTLVEELGDSVLVDLPDGSDPASILLMRTVDGWRIRDYITKPPNAVAPGASSDG
ncbi:MAG: hypothetical protein ABIR17_01295 [Pseudolysinimonas sp.]|uniref:protein kinase domain-containing protein n=1 Tax=Pseudolysinimonas sp. TaxID=2680009 RepID=UPI003265B2A3